MKIQPSKTSPDKPSLDEEASNLGIGGHLAPEEDEMLYRQRMKDRQKVQKQRLQERKNKKGLIIVFTGEGKGKTTAALGIALRSLGHGHKVAIVQFIKGSWVPGEANALKRFEDKLDWHALGGGFTWNTQDRDLDKKFVSEAWNKSLEYIKNKDHNLVILDEINIAIKLGYLSLEEVLNSIQDKPFNKHLILTGRYANQDLIKKADLVTEMTLLRHPFKEQGIKAQEGIEF